MAYNILLRVYLNFPIKKLCIQIMSFLSLYLCSYMSCNPLHFLSELKNIPGDSSQKIPVPNETGSKSMDNET